MSTRLPKIWSMTLSSDLDRLNQLYTRSTNFGSHIETSTDTIVCQLLFWIFPKAFDSAWWPSIFKNILICSGCPPNLLTAIYSFFADRQVVWILLGFRSLNVLHLAALRVLSSAPCFGTFFWFSLWSSHTQIYNCYCVCRWLNHNGSTTHCAAFDHVVEWLSLWTSWLESD